MKWAVMRVEQIWTGNSLRNFNYLIACPETGDALAIDPLDYKRCLAQAEKHGLSITQILNTHEHGDHTGGNAPLMAATGAKLLAHANAKDTIENIDRGLVAGDVVRVGRTVELEALDTPGHTMSHICLLSHTDSPALFSGDTLFNAGAGHCRHGGHTEELYQTFEEQLAQLSDNTRIFPGHDYLENNLRFTMDREPDNQEAGQLLEKAAVQNPEQAIVTTLGLEKRINTFFRLSSPTVIEKLREKFPELPTKPDERDVFLKLRQLRNSW